MIRSLPDRVPAAVVAHLLICLIFLVNVTLVRPAAADIFYWDDDGNSSPNLGGAGVWDAGTQLGALNWRLDGPTGTLIRWNNSGEHDAYLTGIGNSVTLDAVTTIRVNDLFVNPDSSGTFFIAGAANSVLVLGGTTTSDINVVGSSTLSITSGLRGLRGFTKSGSGTLILDSLATSAPNFLYGQITINDGTLQAGGSNAGSGAQVLRSNAVHLASTTSLLTTSATSNDLRSGQLSGIGTVQPNSNGAITLFASANAAFSGVLSTSGGLTLRGTGAVQTVSGNATALSGTVAVHATTVLQLSGTVDNDGVLGATSLAVRGGTLRLNNTAGNTGVGAGRIPDAAGISFLGGTLELLGHTTGTTETLGALTLNSGSATIRVEHNGGVDGTVLGFTGGGNLRSTLAMTVNFVGVGGTLGTAGGNPRIVFSSGVNSQTINGLLTTTSSGTTTTYGWARVNDTSWAGYGPNGIVAMPETSRDSATLKDAAAWEITTFVPSLTTTSLTAQLGFATNPLVLKISPTAAGQSLSLAGNSIRATALMLVGPHNFSITGTSAGGLNNAGNARYVYVIEPSTVLSYSAGLPSDGALTKAGAGTLFLSASSTQVPANSSVHLLQGVLRSTLPALGSTAGVAGTTLNFRGGVLELDGGGSSVLYRPAISVTAGTGGSIVTFTLAASDRGEGGFSAVNGSATVTLVTARGGTTTAALRWGLGDFLADGYALVFGSVNADGRLTFTNSLAFDNGVGPYVQREFRVIDNPNSAGDVVELTGIISGSATSDLLKTGGGVLELTRDNTYTGGTIVAAGTLALRADASIHSSGVISVAAGATFDVRAGAEVLSGGDVVTSGTVRADGVVNAPVTVENGGLLQGAGTVGAVNLRSGGIVSPGNSVGTLTTTAASTNQWYGGATVYFEFKNADTDPVTAGTQGTAGTDWDYLDLVDGSLTISATSADRITIRIDSWLPNNTGHGQADSFDPSGSYRWLFVRATGGITFTSGTDVFAFETTTPGFGVFGTGNPYTMVPGGNFRIAAIGNELYIEYDAVPEPSSLALTSLAGAAALSRGNRLRRRIKRRET